MIYTQKKERLSAVAKESVTDAEPKKKVSKKLKSETQEEIKIEETKPQQVEEGQSVQLNIDELKGKN